jgi:hypothetical protein
MQRTHLHAHTPHIITTSHTCMHAHLTLSQPHTDRHACRHRCILTHSCLRTHCSTRAFDPPLLLLNQAQTGTHTTWARKGRQPSVKAPVVVIIGSARTHTHTHTHTLTQGFALIWKETLPCSPMDKRFELSSDYKASSTNASSVKSSSHVDVPFRPPP